MLEAILNSLPDRRQALNLVSQIVRKRNTLLPATIIKINSPDAQITKQSLVMLAQFHSPIVLFTPAIKDSDWRSAARGVYKYASTIQNSYPIVSVSSENCIDSPFIESVIASGFIPVIGAVESFNNRLSVVDGGKLLFNLCTTLANTNQVTKTPQLISLVTEEVQYGGSTNGKSHDIVNVKSQDAAVTKSKGLANVQTRSFGALGISKIVILDQEGGMTPLNTSHVTLVNLAQPSSNFTRYLAEDLSLQRKSDIESIVSTLDKLDSDVVAVLTNEINTEFITALLTTQNFKSAKSADGYAKKYAPIHSPPTVVRKGYRIRIYSKLDMVNLHFLTELLEKSFKRKLVDSYWDRIRSDFYLLVIAQDTAGKYIGACIITKYQTKTDVVLQYLDKFAVDPDNQGSGVSEILWKILIQHCPNVCWKSRESNPINKWYFTRCNGYLRVSPEWILFWCDRNDSATVKFLLYGALVKTLPHSFQ